MILDFFRKKKIQRDLASGFPSELSSDVEKVVLALRQNISGIDESGLIWKLSSGESVSIPYRINISQDMFASYRSFSKTQEIIMHCIYSRSLDGFVREGHLKWLLNTGADCYEWVKPYVVSLSGDYVMEIVEALYEKLDTEKMPEYRTFCKLNFENTRLLHAKMISYWNEFYRNRCYLYKDYIGKKLFSEIFGMRKSGQKQIEIK